jgi:hypothetical protein
LYTFTYFSWLTGYDNEEDIFDVVVGFVTSNSQIQVCKNIEIGGIFYTLLKGGDITDGSVNPC